MIVSDDGIEKIPFASLPKEICEKYGYNPASLPEGIPSPPPGSLTTPTPKPIFEPGEIKLKTGVVMKGTVGKFTPETIQVVTESGTTQLLVSDLDPDFCLQFVPQSMNSRRIRELDNITKALGALGNLFASAPKPPQGGAVPQETPNPSEKQALKPGINLDGLAAKEISRDDMNCEVGWKVNLYNNGDDALTDVTVVISFQDKDGIEMASDVKFDVSVGPRERKTVTSSFGLETSVWDKVDKYEATTK